MNLQNLNQKTLLKQFFTYRKRKVQQLLASCFCATKLIILWPAENKSDGSLSGWISGNLIVKSERSSHSAVLLHARCWENTFCSRIDESTHKTFRHPAPVNLWLLIFCCKLTRSESWDWCFKAPWKPNVSYLGEKSPVNFTDRLFALSAPDKVALEQRAQSASRSEERARSLYLLPRRGRRRPAVCAVSRGNMWLCYQLAIQHPLLYCHTGRRDAGKLEGAERGCLAMLRGRTCLFFTHTMIKDPLMT